MTIRLEISRSGQTSVTINVDELYDATSGEVEQVNDALIARVAWQAAQWGCQVEDVCLLWFITDDDEKLNIPNSDTYDGLEEVAKLTVWSNTDNNYRDNKCVYAYLDEQWARTDFDEAEFDRIAESLQYEHGKWDKEEFAKEFYEDIYGDPGGDILSYVNWDDWYDDQFRDNLCVDYDGTTYIFEY